MLTRLRVQGFKNLEDVDVRFGPFTCIAGPNGAGKSNLFDAIHFLHLLTKHPIMEAAQLLREAKGRSPGPRALFTSFENYVAPEMRFTAEIIVDRNVQDDFGVAAEASLSTVEYEVVFALRREDGVERMVLVEERLDPVAPAEARKRLGFPASEDFLNSCISGCRTGAFVSTDSDSGEIQVHPECQSGRRLPAARAARTVIGGMASSEYPTVLAVHREMRSWQTILLEPTAMRAPSSYDAPGMIDSRGADLAAMIVRMEKSEESPGSVRAELANTLAELIPDVLELRIQDNPQTETRTLEVRGRNGIFHPAGTLSDGTLRFLSLVALAVDRNTRGVFCLEEPENGIHPDHIPAMVRLLRDIAADTDWPADPPGILRQVIVNTHSPSVLRNTSPRHELVYMDEITNISRSASRRVACVKVPEGSWRDSADNLHLRLAPGRILPYLGTGQYTENLQQWLDYSGEAAVSL